MIILAILAAFAIPRVLGRPDDARRAAAVADLQNFKTALDMYKADNGDYPTTEQGLESLRVRPTSDPAPRNWNGPYLKEALRNDPWGNPYYYAYPAEHNTADFDVASWGSDGQSGGDGKNADITNWEGIENEQR